MNLSTLFVKPVDRPIEGVIKADDEASLRLEVEEYVLTNEVAKRLESFLDAYNHYAGANGVWVSGFFGSGKSHLLKILAMLLENRLIDGVPVLDLFLTKPEVQGNAILLGDLKHAVAIPSKSILFNIDQKADVISKTQIDALLSVFVKVFDEMCGYYGKQGHIAAFERDLDSRDQYRAFKDAYRVVAGVEWESGRELALLESQNIAQAYANVTGTPAENAIGILDKYRSDYKVSIEDFAEQVQAYIERQGPEFRLNFFVDEVGQYVADNVKLMTNLQTIAESLATKCRGRAWVIVTAQEDMNTVIGEMTKEKENDFSKIQDRFKNRMKLTSADVAEVIQKRLLQKTEDGADALSLLYHDQANNFKTLFDFADGSQTYRNFKDRDHFVYCYPFIPYQFTLFQSAIQNLSQHNAFEGKHSSVGERSMLGVFQQVAIQISGHEVGELATFDLMFEGIRTALKAQIQRSVLVAEEHLGHPFAVRVLKALFLVKYVREFKATVRNLCVLMFDSFGCDVPALRAKVEEAVNLLEQQTYIQRKGDIYEYLTDEEKDVEQEIKNTEVETTDVAEELAKIVFDGVIKQRKIRSDEYGQDYPYSRKLDDRLIGREYELAIHVVSPFHENAVNEDILRMQSMGRDELLVIMPADEKLVRDLLMYKRTEKYIRQNVTITQQETIKRILTDKSFQNRERYTELQLLVQKLLGKATLHVAGAEIEINSEDAQSRIIRGFLELILRTYPNLRMLRGITYTEGDIIKCLQQSGGALFSTEEMGLSEAEQEMLAFIQGNSRNGIRTTLKGVVERFERKPYGWYLAAILCTLAKVCARGKVEARMDGNQLEDSALERALRNTHGYPNVVLEPQADFTASQVRLLKEFYEDFFDVPPRSNDAKALGKETGAALLELMHRLTPLAAQAAQYPFLNALTPMLEKLKELTSKSYTWYLTELLRQEDTLLDLKEAVIDPVNKFMNGPQKGIFDNARKFVQTQEPNFAYIEGDEPAQVISCLADLECFKGNSMQQVKTQVETLQEKIASQVEAEVTKAKETVDALKGRLCGMAEFNALSGEQQKQITQPFNDFTTTIERQKLIAVIRDTLRRFEESDYQRLLSQMTTWAQPAPAPVSAPEISGATKQDDHHPNPSAKPELRIEYVPSRSVRVSFEKAWLADEVDVDRYLESMRTALLDEIRKGKRIQI